MRRAALAIVVSAGLVAAVWWARFRPFVSTEDARVAAPVVNVAPSGAGGRVERVLHAEGELVHAGDALVELDARAERAQLARAQAALQVAQARVRTAEAELALEQRLIDSGEQRAAAGVSSAQAAVSLAVHGARREELERSRASLAAAEARAADLAASLQRAESLERAGALSRAEVDHARAAELQGREAMNAARAGLEELERGTRSEQVAMARGELAAARAQLAEASAGSERVVVRAQRVDEARAAEAEARAAVEIAEVALERATLRSSVDGVVLRVAVDPGDYVATGQTAITVADTEHAWISANVEETAVGLVRAGQPVDVEIDEGGTLEGRVEVVAQSAASQFALIPAESAAGNFTKVVQRIPIRVAIEGAGGRPLRVGQSVVLRIRVR